MDRRRLLLLGLLGLAVGAGLIGSAARGHAGTTLATAAEPAEAVTPVEPGTYRWPWRASSIPGSAAGCGA